MIMPLARKIIVWVLLLLITACSGLKIDEHHVLPEDNKSQQHKTITAVWSKQSIQLFNLANTQLITDRDLAIKTYQKVIQLESKMEAAYFNLMRIFYEQGKSSEMITLLGQVKKEQILSARILTIIAADFRRKGKFNIAETNYLLALDKDTSYLPALANMAILQDLYLHNLPEALKYYQQYQHQLVVEGKEDTRVVNWLADIKLRISRLNKEISL